MISLNRSFVLNGVVSLGMGTAACAYGESKAPRDKSRGDALKDSSTAGAVGGGLSLAAGTGMGVHAAWRQAHLPQVKVSQIGGAVLAELVPPEGRLATRMLHSSGLRSNVALGAVAGAAMLGGSIAGGLSVNAIRNR